MTTYLYPALFVAAVVAFAYVVARLSTAYVAQAIAAAVNDIEARREARLAEQFLRAVAEGELEPDEPVPFVPAGLCESCGRPATGALQYPDGDRFRLCDSCLDLARVI